MIKTVLFDLDGTLIDTAPDMAAALDQLCREEDQLLLAFDKVRPVVSDGSVALVKLAFGHELEDDRLEYLKTRYLDIYKQKIAVHSKLFEGTQAVLDFIEQHGLNWGVVTNKPGWLTVPLMEALGLAEHAACIVSGDTTENRKPHPEPMYHACELAGSQAEECMYIGDAHRDIEAGNNAGMKTLIALYGYIGELEDTKNWKADHCIDKPEEILEYL
ncbi:MAG: HAD-IA family hydrolase [Gammaproteobacteria bacterium]|nr:HAD-IA family hydrolase [Gammaproteobacteria bacterium]MCK5262261.1 HAD-IA family hydrolase [Gammaproteobacteria bacterium]